MESAEKAASETQRLRAQVKELQAQLKQAGHAGFLGEIIDEMREGIQVLDFEWRYMYLNRAAAEHGRRAREELLGQKLMDMYPGIETTTVFASMKRCMDEREVVQLVNEFKHPDGSKAWFDLHINPVQHGILVLSVDVTAERNSEFQLRHAQRMESIGRLAGGIAHDFNNLLTVISGYSSLLKKAMPEGDPKYRKVDLIAQAGDRAKALTRQLLAFSRKQVLKLQVVQPNEVIKGMEDMLQRLLGEGVDLDTCLSDGLGRVLVDPVCIEQILMNLSINARDAMPEGGQVTIETKNVDLDEDYVKKHIGAQSGPHVMIAVSDTGTGMDPATQSKIFEPFFTTKEQGKGTGLGLATVFGIVKQSGGNIWVYSEVGQGTTFKVYLPRDEQDRTPEIVMDDTKAPERGSETILLVEDDDAVRELTDQILQSGGYHTLVADGVDQALKLVAQYDEEIHLLLTDVVLKESNGRKLAEQILVLRPGIKIVFMSGYTDDAIVRHGVLAKGTPFIAKPFQPESLLSKLRTYLTAK